MPHPAAGEVVWYVTGRFYAVEEDSSAADYGYFLHLAGVADSLFNGKIGEATAHLTFAARPFAPHAANNASLAIGLDPVGEFSVFLQREPAGTFEVPMSFAQGERVATFRRIGLVVGTTVEENGPPRQPLIASNVFSARLVDSRPFRLGNGRYDLREIVGDGVTQFGIAAGAGVRKPPQGYASAVPFTGSAMRLG